MKTRNLNKVNVLVHYPMTFVMAQAWSLSIKCRRHVRAGYGFLRNARGDLK